jgi:hypothetical protein
MRHSELMDRLRPSLQKLVTLVVATCLGSLSLPLGCGSDGLEPQVAVLSVGPTPILPRSQLVIVAEGDADLLGAVEGFELQGELDGEFFEQAGALRVLSTDDSSSEKDDDKVAWIAETPTVWGALRDEAQSFVGELRLEGREGTIIEVEKITLLFKRALEPRLGHVLSLETWWGESTVLPIQQGLLFREGTSALELDGRFWTLARDHDEEVRGLRIPCGAAGRVATQHLGLESALRDYAGRDRCPITIGPSTFPGGVGWFRGDVRIVNLHADGTMLRSDRLRGTISVLSPELSFGALKVSRGRWIDVSGRGLWMGPLGEVRGDGEKGSPSYTHLRLEGIFKPMRGAVQSFVGDHAVRLRPEVGSSGRLMRVVLRSEADPVLGLTGLGSTPGRFEGQIATVTARDDGDDVVVVGGPVAFEVGTPTQIVQLRFLPEFADALQRFGLEVEREAVIARVFEVVRRDFAEFAVSVVEEAPEAFADYMVVEIGGEDPNRLGLLGLDNSPDKDVGNVHLDEVIGMREGDAVGFTLSGGIFVSEFMRFSPRVGQGTLVSDRFDEVFEEFSPELGGIPVGAREARGESSRQPTIERAVVVLGNLIGSTVTHEVGHALGLTAIDGRVHNEGDTPFAIMDEGVARPFEERAELDGRGPATWEPHNRLYLESILPRVDEVDE